MALDLFDRLHGAKQRIDVGIAAGTHMLLMEPMRRSAFEQMVAFLASAFSGADS